VSREWEVDELSSRPESPSMTVSESESLPRSEVSRLADVFAASDTPWERRGREREAERRGDWMGERMRYRWPDEFISSIPQRLAGSSAVGEDGSEESDSGCTVYGARERSRGGRVWCWGLECGCWQMPDAP